MSSVIQMMVVIEFRADRWGPVEPFGPTFTNRMELRVWNQFCMLIITMVPTLFSVIIDSCVIVGLWCARFEIGVSHLQWPRASLNKWKLLVNSTVGRSPVPVNVGLLYNWTARGLLSKATAAHHKSGLVGYLNPWIVVKVTMCPCGLWFAIIGS